MKRTIKRGGLEEAMLERTEKERKKRIWEYVWEYLMGEEEEEGETKEENWKIKEEKGEAKGGVEEWEKEIKRRVGYQWYNEHINQGRNKKSEESQRGNIIENSEIREKSKEKSEKPKR